MVKSYQRYEPLRSFGIIASPSGNVIQYLDADHKAIAIVPALENVLVWDMKTGECISRWSDYEIKRAEVTCLARGKDIYAVGYSDGSIRLWRWSRGNSPQLVVTLKGHRSAISTLIFDLSGTRLASGSKDTDIIMWDVVEEVGMYRLKGHRDQITQLAFLTTDGDEPKHLVSSSKDTLMKLWDLTVQHCVETLVAHKEEVWSFDILNDLIITGGVSRELKVWKLNRAILERGVLESEANDKVFSLYGKIERSSEKRVVTINFHQNGRYIGVQAADKSVEIFRLRTEEEIKKKLARKKRRQREKEKKEKKGEGEVQQVESEITPMDQFEPMVIVRTSSKARSFQFLQDTPNDSLQIIVSCGNNKLETYAISTEEDKQTDYDLLHSIELGGHRSDVRVVCISSNDELIASASNGMLKIWNARTGSCIRSLVCGNAVCGTFLPKDRHIALGTESGDLEIFDIAASTLLHTVKKAHESTLWGIQVRDDGKELMTGGGDKQVKFWEILPSLEIKQKRILKLNEDVLAVKYSHHEDSKRLLICVSLLDSTVKVFFADTLKFFLSLYGHKLPVLSMDISYDSKLLVTCSADKNVKIWGLDFGDCHKSIFAHDDSIMQVSFVPNSHHFFTVSKDKVVKHWDGDKFENIQKLEGHMGEVWALAISSTGDFVVTGSHDRSIRIWEQTDEELFIEEEREKELEELYDTTDGNRYQDEPMDDAVPAHMETRETLMDGEKILEALELAEQERTKWATYEEAKKSGQKPTNPTKDPLLLALGDISIELYVMRVIERVATSHLHDALLVLPFDKVLTLFYFIDFWANKEWNTVLVCRLLFFLLQVHHDQIIANKLARPMLDSIRKHLRHALTKQKDIIGYNIAAIKYIKREYDANNSADFFDEQPEEEKKRKFVTL